MRGLGVRGRGGGVGIWVGEDYMSYNGTLFTLPRRA